MRLTHGVIWLFLLLPVLLVASILWFGRRHVAIRRKNCCGKGCGCIFPANRD